MTDSTMVERDPDLIAETGACSRDWNRREFIAKQIAREDGKRWAALPNVSTLWFKDKLHYRMLATTAINAARLFETHQKYRSSLKGEGE